MINALGTLKKYIEDGGKVWETLDITFADGAKKTLQDEIMGENCSFSDCAESSSFPIGRTIGKTMTFELDNTADQWKDYNFYRAVIHASIRAYMPEDASEYSELLDRKFSAILDSNGDPILTAKSGIEGTIQTINKGTYTVIAPEQYGEIVSVTAIDDMYKANTKYISSLSLPQTAINLLRDACGTLGIVMGFATMNHGNVIISEIPEDITFRQLIGYIAMLDSANARIDVDGRLQFIHWNFSATNTDLLDYTDQPTFSSDDISITGIRLKNASSEAFYGNKGYVLSLDNGIISDTDLNTIAALIGDSLIGARFRSLQGELSYNPFLEFGDVVYSYDRNMNRYITPITDVTSTINGITKIKTQADDPIRGQSDYSSESNNAITVAKKLVSKEAAERQKAVKQLSEALNLSSGLYMTREQLDDGSYIYYMHDRINLSESSVIWKLTKNAFAISTDGGKTYPYGFTVNGELITSLLYAEGINADYITSGEFSITNDSGKKIFSASKDTGRVLLDASSVFIGSSSVEKRIEDLQNQTDGNIQSWTSSAVPSLDNYPANQWLTDNEKSTHVGDIYYDNYNHAYRFRYGENGYEWKLLKDTDITKALQDAAEAKEEADSAKKIAALAKNMTMQLTNAYQGIPVDSDGNYDTFPECTTSPIVMYGSEDITDSCTISITTSDGVTGTWRESSRLYTVTGLLSDSGWVDFRATYIDALTVVKRFTITKQYAGLNGKNGSDGAPGRTYYIQATPNSFKKGADNTITPSFVNASSYYRDGNGEAVPYNGRWKVQKSKDGKEWADYITTSVDSPSISVALGSKVEESFIRIVLYEKGNTNVTLDVQDIPILTDVSALTQEEIVKILSNDGEWKGLYYLNGKLYISFNSALGGLLSLGGVNNGNGTLKIVDASGNEIGFIDNTGVNFQKGDIRGSKFVTGNADQTQRIEIDASKESFYIDTVDEDGAPYDDDSYFYAGCVTPVKEKGGITSDWLVIDGEVPGIGIEASYFFTLKLDQSDIFHVDRSQTRIDNDVIISKGLTASRTTYLKNLSVSGTKNRTVKTQDYGTKLLHSYEMPLPMFGDCGSSRLNDLGEDIIPIDDIFLETVNTGIEYQVFLQKEGPGDIWVEAKEPQYFSVKGTSNLKYSWEIKAAQKDYEHTRWISDLDNISEDDTNQYDTLIERIQFAEMQNADKQAEILLREIEKGWAELEP